MVRLFVALPLPPAIREPLAALRTDLAGARWTRPEHLHLTLRFLGDTPEENLPALTEALAAVTGTSFPLRLDGLTTFPDPRQPRVLVVKVEPHPALLVLQARIEAAAEVLGYPRERRPFRPHVTLARFRQPDPEAVRAFTRGQEVEAAFTAETFVLYQSTLRPEGAVHEPLVTFPLAAP